MYEYTDASAAVREMTLQIQQRLQGAALAAARRTLDEVGPQILADIVAWWPSKSRPLVHVWSKNDSVNQWRMERRSDTEIVFINDSDHAYYTEYGFTVKGRYAAASYNERRGDGPYAQHIIDGWMPKIQALFDKYLTEEAKARGL